MNWTRWTAVVALTLTPNSLLAAEPDYDKEAGKALFDVAMSRMREGKIAEACQKLEESVVLYSGTGILFQLGACYETLGRTASAWRQFKLVAQRSRADAEAARETEAKQRATARQDEAERRAAALEQKLPKVIISVSEQARALGLELRLDDHVLSPDEWNVPLVQDEGKHGLQARAPGKQAWQKLVIVKPAPDVVTVVVPALVSVSDEGHSQSREAPPPSPRGPEDMDQSQPVPVEAALVAGGIVGTGAGAVLTLLAAKDYRSATDYAKTGHPTQAQAMQDMGDGKLIGGLSLISLGLVSAVVGGALLVSDMNEPTKTGWIAPTVGPKGGGLSAGGTF